LERVKGMQRKSIIVFAVGAAAIVSLAIPQPPKPGALVWNFTGSVPLGLYSIGTRAWRRDDRVAVKPEGRLAEILQSSGVLKEGRLLLKRVAAASGDEVCRTGDRIAINGLAVGLAQRDEALPVWSGCLRLNHNEVFFLGETQNSFDGRYFGVTSAREIVGPVDPILVFER